MPYCQGVESENKGFQICAKIYSLKVRYSKLKMLIFDGVASQGGNSEYQTPRSTKTRINLINRG